MNTETNGLQFEAFDETVICRLLHLHPCFRSKSTHTLITGKVMFLRHEKGKGIICQIVVEESPPSDPRAAVIIH